MNHIRMFVPQIRPRMQFIRNCQSAASSDKTKLVKPTNMQRNYLLWSKMYKTAEEIPAEVSYTKLKRATDWARIRINIAMCLATVIGCLAMVYAGKKEHSWGRSLEKENLAWHQKINEEAAAKGEIAK